MLATAEAIFTFKYIFLKKTTTKAILLDLRDLLKLRLPKGESGPFG